MSNAAQLRSQSHETIDLLWQITIALHVAFNLPEGSGLRGALGAPQAIDNKEALSLGSRNNSATVKARCGPPL